MTAASVCPSIDFTYEDNPIACNACQGLGGWFVGEVDHVRCGHCGGSGVYAHGLPFKRMRAKQCRDLPLREVGGSTEFCTVGSKRFLCNTCGGSGETYYPGEDSQSCPGCNGKGHYDLVRTYNPHPFAAVWRDREIEVDGEPYYTVEACQMCAVTPLKNLPVLGRYLVDHIHVRECPSVPGGVVAESFPSYLLELADQVSVLGRECSANLYVKLFDALYDHLEEFQKAFCLYRYRDAPAIFDPFYEYCTEAVHLRRIFFKCLHVLDRIYSACPDLLFEEEPMQDKLFRLRVRAGARDWSAYSQTILHYWIYGVFNETDN